MIGPLLRAKAVLARNVMVLTSHGLGDPWRMDYDDYLDSISALAEMQQDK